MTHPHRHIPVEALGHQTDVRPVLFEQIPLTGPVERLDRPLSTRSTEPIGSLPIAVSAARTSPWTPSSSVFTMSFGSAMVGGGRLATIDSKRLVATYTGQFRHRFARRIIAFCENGMYSRGHSRERSPRSMMIESAGFDDAVHVAHAESGFRAWP